MHRDGTVTQTLPGLLPGIDAPQLPGMSDVDEVASDLWSMGLTVGKHPTEFAREELRARAW